MADEPPKFRTPSEIKSDLESLKDEIEEETEKANQDATHFLGDLDKTVLNIEQQNKQNVDQLNTKVKKLEDEISQSYTTSRDGVENLLNGLSERATEYFKYTVIVFFFLVLASVYYIVPNDLMRVALLIIYGVVSAIVYYRVKYELGYDSQLFNETVNSLRSVSRLKSFSNPELIYAEKVPRLKKLAQTIGSVLASVAKAVPGVDKVYAEISLVTKFERKVKEFQSALDYYNIRFENDELFFSEIRESPPAEAKITDDEATWEALIIKKIVSEMTSGEKATPDVVNLLHKEHNDQNTGAIFRRIKENKNSLKNLAAVLANSNKLTPASGSLTYGMDDLVEVLEEAPDFSLSEINKTISNSLHLLDYVQTYSDFLERNDLKVESKPTLKLILKNVDDNLTSFERQIISLCYIFGLSCLKTEIATKELLDGFAKASIPIKFNSEISFRKPACEIASTDTIAVAIVRAYYELKKKRGGDLVTIKELKRNSELIKRFAKDSSDKEFEFLQAELKEGKWYDSTSDYLRALIEEKTKKLEEAIEKVQKFTILKEAVKKTFEEVRIGTIEKAIDAQVFGAYLILSSSFEGGLADIIDSLSKRSLEKQPADRWNLKDSMVIEDVKLKYGVEPKYDFMKYSKGTWVGVLDKGELFTDFRDSFMADVKKALKKSKEAFNIGLVIQRITPSEYSFGILDNVPVNVFTKDYEIAHFVATLASDHVTKEEQASLMTFDRDVNLLKITDTKSIFELVRVENDDIKSGERAILKGHELKDEILRRLEEKLGAKSFESVATDLAKGVITEDAVYSSVVKAFERELDRSNIFAKRFVNVLKLLAIIYEIQKG